MQFATKKELTIDEMYLRPLVGKGKAEKNHCTYDIESKDWIRPFLVGFYDGSEYRQFRDASILQNGRKVPASRYYESGGCIDRFFRFLFGLDGSCPGCNAGLDLKTRLPGLTHTCRKRRIKYSAKHFNIYAHNGGRFDHLFAVPWLERHSDIFSWETVTAGGRVIMLTVWMRAEPKIKWCFRDSVSLIPLSLRKAGDTFCPEEAQKMAMDDYDLDEHDPYWDKYCEVDCVVLHNVITNFTTLIHKLGGRVKITAPGIAIDIFRRSYQKQWIERYPHFEHSCPEKCTHKPCVRRDCTGDECHGCAHEFARLAYYGGRTELFWSYGYDITYFDINSSYPASMLERMPVGKPFEYTPTKSIKETIETFNRWTKDRVGIVECEVEIPTTCKIPPLPYRNGGKLIFPVGSFSGVWDWEELKLLTHPLVKGRITKIKRTLWYQGEPIFREMVQALYHYRTPHIGGCKKDKRTGKGKKCCNDFCNPDYSEGLSFCAKLILNSLYGKFGMQPVREKTLIISKGDPWPKNGYCTDFNNWRVWNVQTVVSASYIIPQIAQHVTTLSRIRLFLGMMKIVEQGKEVFYCDTDSIMSNGGMEEDEELGGWKNEEPGMLISGDFCLPKTYRLKFHRPDCFNSLRCPGCIEKHDKSCKHKDDGLCDYQCKRTKTRMKGIPRDQQTSDAWDHIIGDGGTVRFKQLTQFKSIIRNPKQAGPIMKPVSKSVHARFDKRRMFLDGRTVPLVVTEMTDGTVRVR
jgi:hypothetical protein